MPKITDITDNLTEMESRKEIDAQLERIRATFNGPFSNETQLMLDIICLFHESDEEAAYEAITELERIVTC